MNRERLHTKTCNFLENEYYPTRHIDDYLDSACEAKGEFLVPILRNHPMWDEERWVISFIGETERKIDYENLRDFSIWIYHIPYNQLPNLRNDPIYERFTELIKELPNQRVSQYPNDWIVEVANEILAHFDKGHVTKETKISKIVGRIAPLFGLDKIKEMRKVSWTDHATGEHREKEKDFGWNHYFSLFCDSINPIKIMRRITISVNPLDFLLMSNGDTWNSCHDIKGGYDGDAPGCYSGGTMSYGRDKYTLIAYYTPADTDIDDVETTEKQKRCLFFWGEDKLIQSRVYPDGRDGGDFGLAEEMRGFVRQIISECLGFANVWMLKKGHKEADKYILTKGKQYPDYHYYEDIYVSFPWTKLNNYNKIKVGKLPICPACGERHSNEANILCENCADRYDYHCERCGNGFNEYDYDSIHTEDGYWYCCEECAERDGYTNDVIDADGWFYRDNLYYDDYEERFFAYDDEMVVTEDGNTYANPDNAEADGYVYTQDTNLWLKEMDCYQDARWEEWYESEPEISIYGRYEILYFVNEADAEHEGWVCNEDGEWVRKEDLDEAV